LSITELWPHILKAVVIHELGVIGAMNGLTGESSSSGSPSLSPIDFISSRNDCQSSDDVIDRV
jgi:hypothetical protein